MNKKVELPIVEPIYSTCHSQGSGGAVLATNPSIRNWFLNEAMILSCSRKFLSGFTTPEIDIVNSGWWEIPYLEPHWYSMRFLEGHVHVLIRNLLDKGYYAWFVGVDDYYMEGKSMYRERHYNHDGLIFGYDREEKNYSIFAYDCNWQYNKLVISQKSFERGRKALAHQGCYGYVCGIKPKSEQVEFQPNRILHNLKEYLNSNMEKYPTVGDGMVYGIVVHDYLAIYLDKLFDSSIPYERMDWRVLRLIWEHKKVMLERLTKMERMLELGNDTSTAYEELVKETDTMRMLYASHHLKRRDSLLPIIKSKLLQVKDREESLLTDFLEKVQ